MPSRVPASRRSAASTPAPSSIRLSPASGAAPSATLASARAPSPSSAATSPSRTTSPGTTASRATVIRPPAAYAPVAAASATSSALRHDRIRRPQHLVRGLDRLRGHLVGALAGDEADQLLDHAHVRILEEALEERTAVVLAGRAELRRAGGLALLEEVLA